jgi:hypothetical protein
MSRRRVRGLGPDPIRYRVNLEAEPYIEEIRLFTDGPRTITGRQGCGLFRYGHFLAGFMCSTYQLDKIASRKGRITITQEQIDEFNHLVSPFGR